LQDLLRFLLLAEKTAPDEFRTRFRNALLERWAESDVHAAMAYAEKVTGAQRRQEAVIAVLGKWWTRMGERRGMGEAIARRPLRPTRRSKQ